MTRTTAPCRLSRPAEVSCQRMAEYTRDRYPHRCQRCLYRFSRPLGLPPSTLDPWRRPRWPEAGRGQLTTLQRAPDLTAHGCAQGRAERARDSRGVLDANLRRDQRRPAAPENHRLQRKPETLTP